MKNLHCEHPAIILNPHLKDVVLLHRNYTIRGREFLIDNYTYSEWFYFFDYGKFGTKKLGITLDDVDSCYVTDTHTGDLIPIYMVVPCNKCILCRDKIAREWSTRAMCESQTSSGYPLFVTLTYNDYNIPSDGVCKEHAQTFIKRLRINLNRYLGYDVNLRFFLCSEYGSKTKRPHYHALLWNFPALDSLKTTLSIIEKSWSYMCTRDEYNRANKDFRFYDDKAKRYRIRFGYAYCSLCNDGRVKYCMKYMRKDSEIPKGKNPLFFLSSRRRGIGFQWFQKNLQEYKDNPSFMNVELTDIWSGQTFSGAMPTYFKNMLYPTLGSVLPKDIRDSFKLFNYYHELLQNSFSPRGFSGRMYSDDKQLLEKYRCLPYHHFVDMPTWLVNRIKYDLIQRNKDGETYDDITKHLSLKLDELRQKLWRYEFDCNDYDDIVLRKFNHHYYLLQYIDSLPVDTITDSVGRVHRARVRQLNRELL